MNNQFYKVETNIPGVGTFYVFAPSYIECIGIIINTEELPRSLSRVSISRNGINISQARSNEVDSANVKVLTGGE